MRALLGRISDGLRTRVVEWLMPAIQAHYRASLRPGDAEGSPAAAPSAPPAPRPGVSRSISGADGSTLFIVTDGKIELKRIGGAP